jgi:SAM-dependent methyltransferase
VSAAARPGAFKESWANAEAYEAFVGRWSRRVAAQVLRWLEVPAGAAWLDVGCGSGALTEAIFESAGPGTVTGIDRSPGFVTSARRRAPDGAARFAVGDALALPVAASRFDVVVSGLMLNFVARPEQAAAELARAARPGGVVAAYLWDYAGRMQMLRYFWNAAAALDPAAHDLDQGRRFPLCQPGALQALFESVDLRDVAVQPVDIATDFRDFDDYWLPFLGGQGAAPGYLRGLSEDRRAALRERLRESLPLALDGSIPMVARAWAVRGVRQ